MFIASMILTAVFMMVVFVLSGGGMTMVLDLPSVVIVGGFILIALSGAGLMKDFNRCFGIAFYGKRNYRLYEIKKSLLALKIAVGTALSGGLFGGVLGLVILAAHLDSSVANYSDMLLKSVGVALIPFLYASIFALLMFPIYGVVKKTAIEFMEK